MGALSNKQFVRALQQIQPTVFHSENTTTTDPRWDLLADVEKQ